ncbi:MAG: hypothetical protein KYX69_19830 [Sphingomonas sp.]|uniref:hypothetical protein n=1 Tax=Sphingomonas sp. TaxID=28214 RepID=UPI002635678F|nr:hypothetical protein [Sphingomonas sp.]MDK2769955.1 hypothetical protein [Sphingomonas sp.]
MDIVSTLRAWNDMKALFLHREDRERRERGLPPLETEFEQEAQRFREAFDPPARPITIAHLTAV